MNNEIPNNNPVPGSSPVSAVTPPVTDTPAPAAPVVDAPVAPAEPVTAPIPEVAPVADVPAPAEPAPEAAPVGFDAPPVSTTPVVDLGTMNAPVAPTAPEMAPAAPVESAPAAPAPEAPAAPVVDAPVAPAEPVMPEAAPVAPVAPAAPEMAPAAPVAPAAPEMAPAAPVAPTAPEMAPAAPIAPEAPMQAAPVVADMPGSAPVDAAPATPAPEAAPATPKKKGGAKIIIIIVAILAVLAVAGYFVFTKVLATPEKTLTTTVKTLMKEAKEEIKSNKFVNMVLDTSKPFTVKGDIALQTSMEGYEFLSNYKVDFGLGADYKNNKLMLSAGLNEKDSELLSASLYFLEGKGYADLGELYDKLLLLGDAELDLSEMTSGLSEDDILYLTDAFSNALVAAIEAGDVSSTSSKIDVLGNSTSVTDNVYKINSTNAVTVVKAAVTSLKNDTKAINTIAKLAEMEAKEVTDALDQVINAEGTTPEGVNIEVHVYTGGLLGNKFYGLDVKSDDTVLLQVREDGNKSQTTIGTGDNLIVINTDNGNTKIEVKEGSDVVATINITEASNKLTVSVTASTTTLSLDITTSDITNGFKETLVISIKDTDMEIDASATINLECKQEAFEAISTGDAVAIEEVDPTEIQVKLDEKLSGSELFELLENIPGSFPIDDDFDDYDYYDDDENTNPLELKLFDIKSAGSDASWEEEDTFVDYCYSIDYLRENGFLGQSFNGYTGSILVTSDLDYYIWVSNGINAFKNIDYYDYESSDILDETSASNNCEGQGTLRS